MIYIGLSPLPVIVANEGLVSGFPTKNGIIQKGDCYWEGGQPKVYVSFRGCTPSCHLSSMTPCFMVDVNLKPKEVYGTGDVAG